MEMGSSERLRNISIKILSDNWYTLKRVDFEYLTNEGTWDRQSREAYDRGNGAVILLYNKKDRTVILTRQFRMPTYLNGNPDGMLIEACAGLLDEDQPDVAIRRETEEETGYRIDHIQKVYEAYMSPGSVTEILHFYIAEYRDHMKTSEGGGVEEESEDIEVLEVNIDETFEMIRDGRIKDAKTIMLIQHLRLHNIL